MMRPATTTEVLREITSPRVARPFADRPPTFGDGEQILAINVMNGDEIYCCQCLHVPDYGGLSRVGDVCPECMHGFYVPGARLEPRWRRAEVTIA